MDVLNKKYIYPAKTCDKCNLTIGYKSWSTYLKSYNHQKNDIDQTILPCRLNTKYKGITINQ